VLLGILFGLMPASINTITEWIVFGLAGGYTAPNLLRWHWWRFNGFGYFAGMISGVVFAISFGNLFPNIAFAYSFPLILLVSGLASIAGTYLTPPVDEETLKSFYRQVRPWGFWQPIHDKVVIEHPGFRNNSSAGRDMINVLVGVVWQTSLRLIPVFLVVFRITSMWVAVGLVIVTSVFLKKNWYDKLEDD
jgi:hypothetical protein